MPDPDPPDDEGLDESTTRSGRNDAPAETDPASTLAFRTPLQEHPPAADSKAAVLLTGLGIMIPLLAKYAYHLESLIEPLGRPAASWHFLRALVLAALVAAFLLLSLGTLVQAFRTLWPRFPEAEPSLAFFGDIARLTRDRYHAEVVSLTHERVLEHILNYNHTLSSICVAKFRQLAWAIRWFQGAFACWLALMLALGLVEARLWNSG